MSRSASSGFRYDPDRHHRRSIRLPGYDYAQPGAYFVTICTQDRACLFGDIVDEAMVPNDLGQIAAACWQDIPAHFPHVTLDAFALMPNHVHGIVVLTDPDRPTAIHVGAGSPRPSTWPTARAGERAGRPRPYESSLEAVAPTMAAARRPTLGQVVAWFKYQTTKDINQLRGTPGLRLWQRNYYEHVIRDEADLHRTREYIDANPARWTSDKLHPDNPFRWQPPAPSTRHPR